MKIAIFTGPRSITDADAQLVRAAVREVIAREFQIHVGDASGTDNEVIQGCMDATNGRYYPKVFFPINSLGRTPAGLAERSTRMVKEALAQTSGRGCFQDELICIGFPNKPCPAGIVPAKSWRSGNDEGSGTWSTLALATGLNIETWIFTIGNFRAKCYAFSILSGWSNDFKIHKMMPDRHDIPVAWHFSPTQTLFTKVQP